MDGINEKVNKVLKEWANRTVPDGMSASELRKFSAKIGLNWETLKSIRRRKTYKADTIIRTLLGSGVAVKTLIDLPVNPKLSLLPREKEWIQFGRTLSEKERIEYIKLIKHVQEIIKNRYKAIMEMRRSTNRQP